MIRPPHHEKTGEACGMRGGKGKYLYGFGWMR